VARILAVNWRDIKDPDGGGAEIHLYEILTRMAANGHEVVWFSCRYPGSKERENYGGIEIHRYGHWYDANFVLPRKIRSYLRYYPVDLVVEDINKVPFFMPLYTKTRVMAVIPHLFGATVFRETNPIFASYVYLFERFIPRVHRNCDFAVISPSTRDDLVARGVPEENTHVVLCGLDHDVFNRIEGLSRYSVPTIIHFGRVRKYKSIDTVIRAFVRIRDELPEARLLIIGDGPELPNLKKVAARTGVGDAISFLGALKTEEMVTILNQAHLFLNASPKEGWGLTVVEANACGVPVIGSDRPGLRDSIINGKTGYLVDYGDDVAFAARAVELLRDPEQWQRMSTGAIEWANSLTWDRTAAEMEEVFLRDIERGSHQR
jgi:glycosyltransferase involved in cell wall biosynthesis